MRETNSSLSRSLIQLIGLGRALIDKPKVLLLDKADSGLDQQSADVYAKMIDSLKGKCTIVIVTDNKKILKTADKVYDMVDGKIIISKEFKKPRASRKKLGRGA